jgi:hypothetical protein
MMKTRLTTRLLPLARGVTSSLLPLAQAFNAVTNVHRIGLVWSQTRYICCSLSVLNFKSKFKRKVWNSGDFEFSFPNALLFSQLIHS